MVGSVVGAVVGSVVGAVVVSVVGAVVGAVVSAGGAESMSSLTGLAELLTSRPEKVSMTASSIAMPLICVFISFPLFQKIFFNYIFAKEKCQPRRFFRSCTLMCNFFCFPGWR